MTRGNWQHRVERTEARRLEVKQKKKKMMDKRIYKSFGQNLLAYFDRSTDAIKALQEKQREQQKGVTVHIWTSALPSDDYELAEVLMESKNDIGGGRLDKKSARSTSFDTTLEKRKGRGRSSSDAGSHKKVHPRSKEAYSNDNDEDDVGVPDLWLCRSHFFANNCSAASRGGGKKNACGYKHYSRLYKTLCTVLTGESDKNAELVEKELHNCEVALLENAQSSNVNELSGCMEMLYYVSIDLSNTNDDQCLSQQINDQLNKLQVPLSSIFYCSINDILLFDQNQAGLVVPDNAIAESIAKDHSLNNLSKPAFKEKCNDCMTNLPGMALMHILSFLEDYCIARLSLVCKSWDKEIGQGTPTFWRDAMDHRDWPYQHCDENDKSLLRSVFISHYTAVSRVLDLSKAISLSNRTTVHIPPNVAYKRFSDSKHMPKASSDCVALEVWDKDSIFAAYSEDCSIRLFKAISSTNELIPKCKEVAYMVVDPYLFTTRRKSSMSSCALGQEFISCVCYVSTDQSVEATPIVVFVNREIFLLRESSELCATRRSLDSDTNLVDLTEAVLDYVLTSGRADECWQPVFDFLYDEGELSDISTYITGDITACNHGCFILEVSVSVPDSERFVGTVYINSVLVVLSAFNNSIVWVGEYASPKVDYLNRRGDISFVNRHQSVYKKGATSFIAGITTDADIHVFDISETNPHQSKMTLAMKAPSEISELGPRNSTSRLLVCFESCVVSVDRWFTNNHSDQQCTMIVYSQSNENFSVQNFCILPDVRVPFDLIKINNGHAALLCQTENKLTHVLRREIIVIDAMCSKEVARVCVGDIQPYDDGLFPLVAAKDNIIGVAWSHGVAIVQKNDCYNNCDRKSVNNTFTSPKKVKTNNSRKKGKKDGFARGMSMSG